VKTVPKLKTAENVEALAEEKKDQFFTDLVMGNDVTEDVETSKGAFILKYPKARDVLTIGKIAAIRRNYKPMDGFDAETEMINMMAATLDVIVVSGPKWYEDAKQTVKNFSFLEVPSRKFLAELYGKAYEFREKVDERIDQGEGAADKRIPAKPGADAPVDGGAFEGLSG
jgi:hypothetical protein